MTQCSLEQRKICLRRKYMISKRMLVVAMLSFAPKMCGKHKKIFLSKASISKIIQFHWVKDGASSLIHYTAYITYHSCFAFIYINTRITRT